MIHHFTWVQWTEAYLHDHDTWAKFSLSPGGAAAAVGVSRQAVHNAIESGRLDAVRIGERSTRAVLVDSDAVAKWALQVSTPAGRMAAKVDAHKRRVETRRQMR